EEAARRARRPEDREHGPGCIGQRVPRTPGAAPLSRQHGTPRAGHDPGRGQGLRRRCGCRVAGRPRRRRPGETHLQAARLWRAEARALAADHALVPVYREVLADMLTPVLAYTLLCPTGEPGFLLESVEGGERLARYSFIGSRPVELDLGDGNPLPALVRVAGESVAPVSGLPRFHGGAVGYLGYETARHFEHLPVADGPAPPMPESAFLKAEDLALFDHVTRRLKLMTIHRPAAEDYDEAVARVDRMEK